MLRVSFYTIIVLIACNTVNGNPDNEVKCRDENDTPVDWYVIYKLPKVPTTSNPLIKQGHAYLYITSTTVQTGWQLSSKSIGSNRSIPGLTLAPLYNTKNSTANLWAFYNDQAPNKNYSTGKYGHTKGVVAVDKDQGFWLIHSVPGFPPTPEGVDTGRKKLNTTGRYEYPESGTRNGQSFLCVSLGSNQFETVGQQLMYNEIIVYGKNTPVALSKQYPVLRNASDQIRNVPSSSNKAVIRSLNSVVFTSFAKSSTWQKDLYAEFVAPQFQTDLYVQSWRSGPGELPSRCTGSKVYNVQSLAFKTGNIEYPSTRDHSKWAISVTNRTQWVCIADINRATTQYSRGGGALCLQNLQLWTHYKNVINDVERCPSNVSRFPKKFRLE